MIFRNNTPDLTLAAAIGTTDTTITVNEDVSWVEPPMTFVIDPGGASEEAVYVTAVDTATKTLTVIRGADGYTAQSHAAGAVMRHMVLGRWLNLWKPYVWWYNNVKQRIVWYFASQGQKTISKSDGKVRYHITVAERPLYITEITLYCQTAGSSDGQTRVAIYDADPLTNAPRNLLWASGAIAADVTGDHTFVVPNVFIEPGVFWIAVWENGYSTAPAWWGQAGTGSSPSGFHPLFIMSGDREPKTSVYSDSVTDFPNPAQLQNGGGDQGVYIIRYSVQYA